MRGRLLLFIALILVGLHLRAQDLSKKEIRLYERYRAFQQIDSLQRFGVILFRLQTSSTTIDALKSKGREDQVARTLKHQRLKNEEVTSEFKEHFDFCPMFFFYSDDIKEIMKSNVQGYLLDDSLSRTSTHNPDLQYYFIGSFSEFNTKHYPHRTKLTTWHREEDMNSPLKGYNLKDFELHQYFSPPFPSYAMSALEWNRALEGFHKKSQKKSDKLKRHPKLIQALKKIESNRLAP